MFLESYGFGDDFGFDVPTGDPNLIDAAGDAFATLAEALAAQRTVISAAKASHWSGPTAGAYAEAVSEMVGEIGNNEGACRSAAGALHNLARALSKAQSVTSKALSECAHESSIQQQQDADAFTYGETAASETRAAASAVPGTSTALDHSSSAQQARTNQGAAQKAAQRAGEQLKVAEQRGQQAVQIYEDAARAATAKLREAEGDLRMMANEGKVAMEAAAFQIAPIFEKSSKLREQLEKFVAGAKKYDARILKLINEQKRDLALAGFFIPESEADWKRFNATVKALEKQGATEKDAAYAAFAADDGMDFEHTKFSEALDGSEKALDVLSAAESLNDLLEGKGSLDHRIDDALSNLKNQAVTDLSSDVAEDATEAAVEYLADAAAIAVPGAGEVVLAGIATVAIADGAEYVIDHPKQVLHAVEDAGDDVESAVKDVAKLEWDGAKEVGKLTWDGAKDFGKAEWDGAKDAEHFFVNDVL